jgi:hypothetical protein
MGEKMGSNREQRDKLKELHVFLALLRTGTNQDHRCMRQVIRDYETDLKFLELRCLARGGEWRIHKTVNSRDPEKAMRYLMKKLIDHPELCTDIDMEWRSALLKPECIYGHAKWMLDVDTEEESFISQLELAIKMFKIDALEKIKSPKGYHYIINPCDTREILGLGKEISLLRDGYYYIKTIKKEENKDEYNFFTLTL